MASHSGDKLHLSEMRILLLGNKRSGKSSSGNTILGSEQFGLKRTARCEKRQGDIGGRQVTVVDSPGWIINSPLKRTSELIKQQIVLSASLCPPGPHALLLVITASGLCTAEWCKYMVDHMQLLGPTVWSHTVILFSYGDHLRGATIEQFIESQGAGLQRLVQKCGNRYHVFDNKNRRAAGTQVTKLLLKIEEMVARNGGPLCGTGSPATPTPDKASLLLGVTQTNTIKESQRQPQKMTQDQQDQSDQVEKLKALLKERERELQNTVTAMEDSKKEQQKLTQEQRDQAEKLTVQMKEKEDTIKEMEDSKSREQKLIQEQQDNAEKLAVQMKEKEDTAKETKDSKSQEHELIQEQQSLSNQVQKLTVQMKEKEDTIKEMEDSKREQQQLTQEQRDQAEKLTVQMKEKEDTIKEMEDSKSREQKLIQEQQDNAEKLAVQMKEMKCQLEKINQRQMEADQQRDSATQQQPTQIITGAEDKLRTVRKKFIQRVSDPVLNELLDDLLDEKIITDEEMGTAMGERLRQNKARNIIDMVRLKGNKASSFMIVKIDQLDHNLCEEMQLNMPPNV